MTTNFGYIRVSTEKQTVENQRYEINEYCKKNGIKIDKWYEETVSGIKDPNKRELGKLLRAAKKGDLIITTELSRLGRSLFMITEVLSGMINKGVNFHSTKENFDLSDDIMSKVIIFAFGISSEVERRLISMRTKEALAKKKEDGVRLGRPYGEGGYYKLSGHEDEIKEYLSKGKSKAWIARKFKVSYTTLWRNLREIG